MRKQLTDRQRYNLALDRQRWARRDAQLRADAEAGRRRPSPARITQVLDLHSLYGPEVDRALGGEEPMVDMWEAGTLVPTYEQMCRLAEMTGVAVWVLYEEPKPLGGPVWLCGTTGCETLPEEAQSNG